jgi:hypothetical protein
VERRPAVRASDADREAAVQLLRENLFAGCLSSDEFEERTDRVYAARTRDELDELTDDLPSARASPPSREGESRPARKPWLPGQRSFSVRFEVGRDPEDVIEEATHIVARA